MRIGIDVRTLSYERTGIPVFLHDILNYWCELGYEDEFYLYSNRPIKIDFKLKSNWKVVIDKKPFGTLWTLFCLPRLIKKSKIDVFWEPMHFLPRRVKGIKYYLTIHDISVLLNNKFGSYTDVIVERLFLKKSCMRADMVMAISKSTKNDLINYLKIEPKKIQVIYNGDSPYNHNLCEISKTIQTSTLDKLKLKKDEYFLFVGTIEPRKNIDTLIQAYEYYRDIWKGSEKLVLAGKRGWRSERFFTLINKSKYKNDIAVTGYISDDEKECLYRNTKALIFPSMYEGFGFPVLEAMSVGTVVITSKVSSLPEIGGEVAFYLNELNNYVELATLINKVSKLSTEELKLIHENSINNSKRFNRYECAKEIYLNINNI